MTPCERLCLPGRRIAVETRDDGAATLTGYAAVFYRKDDPGTEYRIFDDLIERIEPGAFRRALAENQDIRALFNHDASAVLGRVPETLRLDEDEIGLRYAIVLPPTQLGRDVAALVARGDITGSSFSFAVRSQRYDYLDGVAIRWLTDVDLYDVGPVTFPAYDATNAAVRAEADRLKAECLADWDRRRRAAAAAKSAVEAVARCAQEC